MDMTLEVVPVPVSDTDRAIDFYTRLGFAVDMDRRMDENTRFVQLTPPGSACSIHIGDGMTSMIPGSVKGLILVVRNAEEAKAELEGRGISTGEVETFPWGRHVTVTDPDGNTWTLQESYARNAKPAH